MNTEKHGPAQCRSPDGQRSASWAAAHWGASPRRDPGVQADHGVQGDHGAWRDQGAREPQKAAPVLPPSRPFTPCMFGTPPRWGTWWLFLVLFTLLWEPLVFSLTHEFGNFTLKQLRQGLAAVAQVVRGPSCAPEGCRFNPSWGAGRRQLVGVSLSHRCLSLSPSLPSFLYKNQ